MAQRTSSGGCIALAAILAAVAVGAILLFAIFFTKRATSHSPVEMPHPTELHAMAESGMGSSGEGLVFQEGNRPKLSVPAPGEAVTLKHYAAFMIDSDATELAKDSFRKVADQAEVSWRLRLTQVSDRNGALRGEFDVPWVIQHGHGASSSSFSVSASFDEEGRQALLELRRGDWVTVEGQLTFVSGRAAIENAVIADAAE